jgi:hypothetical protein
MLFGSVIMSEDFDPWPLESVGPKEHLHALGVISVHYNLLEDCLLILFGHVAQYHEVGEFLFRRINNHGRLEAIKFHLERKLDRERRVDKTLKREIDDNLLQHIKHLHNYCTICIDNRNILMHSGPNSSSETVLRLEKASKASNAASKLAYYNLSLSDLRGVGDALIQGVHYVLDIERYLRLTEEIKEAKSRVPRRPGTISLNERSEYQEALLLMQPLTLPEKPPLPKRLTAI